MSPISAARRPPPRAALSRRRSQINPLRDGDAAYELVRDKYHLFPGLNWVYPGTKELFIEWIRDLPDEGKILIFDTGTEGNGARQIHNLLVAQLPFGNLASARNVDIVGIVDGDDPRSVERSEEGHGANAVTFRITTRYIKVANVLSEDFQRLSGYKRLSQHGYIRPLRDLGLIRLIDDEGKIIQMTGFDNLAFVFNNYMSNAAGGAPEPGIIGHEELTPEMEKGMVEVILGAARNGESEALANAWDSGFLSEAEAQSIEADIPLRYAQELANHPAHVWSFAEKKVREGLDPDDPVWSAS